MACKRSAVRSRLAPPKLNRPDSSGFEKNFDTEAFRPHRLEVRTLAFHAGNRGSNPLGVAIFATELRSLNTLVIVPRHKGLNANGPHFWI